MQLAADGAGAHRGRDGVERRARELPVLLQLRGGASPPATNVRVMSAQQRDAWSRGQMSIRTTSPRSIGPRALLVADGRLRAVGDDHVVGQLGVVLVADALHLLAHLLAR